MQSRTNHSLRTVANTLGLLSAGFSTLRFFRLRAPGVEALALPKLLAEALSPYLAMAGLLVPEEAVVEHLRFAKTVRVSIEGNTSLCRGLLETRYGGERGLGERPEREEASA